MDNNEPSPLPRKRRPKSRQRRQYIIVLAGVLLLCVSAVLLYFKFFATKPISETVLSQKKQSLTFSSGDANRCYPFGQNLAFVYDDHIVVTDLLRNRLATADFDLTVPIVRQVRGRLFIHDQAGSKLIIISPGGEIIIEQFSGIIDAFDYNGIDCLAVALRGAKGTSSIECRVISGDALFMLELATGKRTTDLAFTDDGKAFDLLVYNLDGFGLQAFLRRLDLKGKMLWQTEPFLPSSLMPFLMPQRGSDHPAYYGAKDYGMVKIEGKMPQAKRYEAITNATKLANGVALTIVEADKHYLVIMDFAGKEESRLELDFVPKALASDGDVVALLGAKTVCFFQKGSKTLSASQALEHTSVRLNFINNNTLVVVTDGGIKQITRG